MENYSLKQKELWNEAVEEAAMLIELLSLLQETGDCFNQNKAGCAAILADKIRELKK